VNPLVGPVKDLIEQGLIHQHLGEALHQWPQSRLWHHGDEVMQKLGFLQR
jgi:hypothetical protein